MTGGRQYDGGVPLGGHKSHGCMSTTASNSAQSGPPGKGKSGQSCYVHGRGRRTSGNHHNNGGKGAGGKGGGEGGGGKYRNFAEEYLWQGYGCLKPLRGGALGVSSEEAARLAKLLDQTRAQKKASLDECCAALSCAAILPHREVVEWCADRMRPMNIFQCVEMFSHFARRFDVSLRVYVLHWREEDGKTEAINFTRLHPSGRLYRSIILVNGGGGVLHALPAHAVKEDASVKAPACYTDHAVGEPESEGSQGPVPEEGGGAATSSAPTPTPAGQDPVGASVEEPPSAGEPPSTRDPAPPAGSDVQPEAFEPQAMGAGAPATSVGTDPMIWEASTLSEEMWRLPERPEYHGPFVPPPAFNWTHGWWARDIPPGGKPSRKAPWRRPRVASATLEMAERHGPLVYYLPFTSMQCIVRGRNGAITDGVRHARPFAEGDVLESGALVYVARGVMTEFGRLLVLQAVEVSCCNLRGFFAGACVPGECSPFALINALPGVRIRPPPPTLKEGEGQRARWMMTVLTAKDPVETAVLKRMQQDQAKLEYQPSVKGALDPDYAERCVSHLRTYYPGASDVKGKFGWGHCMHCGGAAVGKGRMPGRLHKGDCTLKNSTLGELVASGETICSATAPIRYPGVVKTRSRHPPLKANTETYATEGKNFRFAH